MVELDSKAGGRLFWMVIGRQEPLPRTDPGRFRSIAPCVRGLRIQGYGAEARSEDEKRQAAKPQAKSMECHNCPPKWSFAIDNDYVRTDRVVAVRLNPRFGQRAERGENLAQVPDSSQSRFRHGTRA